MNRTGIQWTDFSSNPIRYKNADALDVWACVKVSDGCTNCYSETRALSTRMVGAGRALGAKFNEHEMAKLTPYLDEKELGRLLKAKPRGPFRNGDRPMVFIGDMTDIFGEWVTDEMLDRLFAVFALRPDMVFQVLTKRPERMREYMAGRLDVETAHHVYAKVREIDNAKVREIAHTYSVPEGGLLPWPLPNVWLGTSVEDQERADERIPEVLATPAAVHFISCEPLLGPVNLSRWM